MSRMFLKAFSIYPAHICSLLVNTVTNRHDSCKTTPRISGIFRHLFTRTRTLCDTSQKKATSSDILPGKSACFEIGNPVYSHNPPQPAKNRTSLFFQIDFV